jgi:tRNA acetyltransferase TAN1
MCGDEYPIISKLNFQGLLIALTKIDNKVVIQKIKRISTENPEFFQYILKIIPIDYVCETQIQTISEIIQSSYHKYIYPEDRFKIVLNRRKSAYIDRQSFIKKIASILNNKVDLERPDKIIRVEILGNISGISYLNPNAIIKTKDI